MLSESTIGFVGAGNMAEALIKGLISSGSSSPARILASDRFNERLTVLAERYEIKVYSKNYEVVQNSSVVFLSVKPQDMESCVREIAVDAGGKLLITVAAGITTDQILKWLRDGGASEEDVPVVRAMPNTPALIGEGAIGLAPGRSAGPEELELGRVILGAAGEVTVFDDEALLDTVTGLSGSGPAYVFLFMEALAEGGVELGLSAEEATSLALKTTLGAARLATESEKGLAELREMVSSPGGTTIEGLKALENGRFSDIIKNAVKAATKRAGELSGT